MNYLVSQAKKGNFIIPDPNAKTEQQVKRHNRKFESMTMERKSRFMKQFASFGEEKQREIGRRYSSIMTGATAPQESLSYIKKLLVLYEKKLAENKGKNLVSLFNYKAMKRKSKK